MEEESMSEDKRASSAHCGARRAHLPPEAAEEIAVILGYKSWAEFQGDRKFIVMDPDLKPDPNQPEDRWWEETP